MRRTARQETGEPLELQLFSTPMAIMAMIARRVRAAPSAHGAPTLLEVDHHENEEGKVKQAVRAVANQRKWKLNTAIGFPSELASSRFLIYRRRDDS